MSFCTVKRRVGDQTRVDRVVVLARSAHREGVAAVGRVGVRSDRARRLLLHGEVDRGPRNGAEPVVVGEEVATTRRGELDRVLPAVRLEPGNVEVGIGVGGEVVLALGIRHGRADDVVASDQADGDASDGGLVCILNAVAVCVEPDSVADLDRSERGEQADAAEAAALLEVADCAVVPTVKGELVARRGSAGPDVEPHKAGEPDSRQGVVGGRDDLPGSRDPGEPTERDLVVDGAVAHVEAVVVELTPSGAFVHQPVDRRPGTGDADALERERAITIGRRDLDVATRARLVVRTGVCGVRPVVAVAALDAGAVGESEREVAVGVEEQVGQQRLRVDVPSPPFGCATVPAGTAS